ncbi:lipoprotein-anchoring transpeptidase ErfK/SrfK [Sphingomonas sp. BE270]|jgi:lipoprotein-anchoring transpeptidase ErfK/SrfK|uniref:L,D-transpeptidase family protein n=1 Tax=unclassified Sphingomonas TaxID=196159 RepID=UPI001AE91330|nr:MULTISPECIES: L,D-transpeptidase family protein [unclassified Sphingomonas]MDR6849651.1 lipoprotein-anchoring transpeptidase ErfK/SrfK [Sphingomonas sp. BE137]MDR7258728.1 lipoprotein-anchoring transpeptidase ErfK/SrfK [Sphingomonas sp. BE270]
MRKTLAGSACLAIASLGLVAAAPVGTISATDTPALDLSTLHVQVILDHLGFSPGVLDGRAGKSLVAALKGFQETRGLPQTGEMDLTTLRALHPYAQWRPTQTIALTTDMLAGPFVNPLPKNPQLQARLTTLGYRSPMEKLGEMFHTKPSVLLELNSPQTRLVPGSKIVVPNAIAADHAYDPKLPEKWRQTLSDLNVDSTQPTGAKVVVDKSEEVLRVLDKDGKLVAQFMATMGSEHDPLPIGTWKILGPSYNPPFHYNPKLFWDAKKGARAALLPPGPNGPVGVVWLDLSKPHYGIHGTPSPETIGRAESHGCIRLTNWDAARLAMMIKPGTPAVFQE